MLKLGNDEFYEYAYFERTLECFVRDFLINKILHDLFMIHNIESMWPDNKNYIRYSTKDIEDIFPFEFIFVNNGKKIYDKIFNDVGQHRLPFSFGTQVPERR